MSSKRDGNNSSPRTAGLFAACFAEASESDEPEATEETGDVSDGDAPPALYDAQPSLRRLQTWDAFNQPVQAGAAAAKHDEDEDSDQEIPHGTQESQPSLRRLQTFDPFNQPEELGYGNRGAAGSTASPPTQTVPPSTTVQQGVTYAPQGGQQGGQPVQMQVPMMTAGMPAGYMQAMVPGGQAQTMPTGGHAQMQQGAQMPMMAMAMPAGPGMPGGAMMMVPGNYVGQPGMGFVQAAGVQQGHAASAMAQPARGVVSPGGSPTRSQPQTVTCAQEADGVFRVRWTVDARKLKGNDKTVVSPPFEIPAKASGTFKMMINPTPSKLKGGATFRNSNGRGSVQLKCDTASESALVIRFMIGEHGEEPARGPVEHNFSLNGVCGLPKEVAEWDFTKVVDEQAKVFVVCLELL